MGQRTHFSRYEFPLELMHDYVQQNDGWKGRAFCKGRNTHKSFSCLFQFLKLNSQRARLPSQFLSVPLYFFSNWRVSARKFIKKKRQARLTIKMKITGRRFINNFRMRLRKKKSCDYKISQRNEFILKTMHVILKIGC